MADFKTPNLCGANPELNNALSKIDDLKNEIASKVDSQHQKLQLHLKLDLQMLKQDLMDLHLIYQKYQQ